MFRMLLFAFSRVLFERFRSAPAPNGSARTRARSGTESSIPVGPQANPKKATAKSATWGRERAGER